MRGWWKDTGRLDDMLEANRLILETVERRVEGELVDSQVDGRVVVEPGARLERATVRGPAVIGSGAVLRDAYVGPYTAVGAGCVIENAEVEHSILLEASSVRGLEGRMESSLLGKNVAISRDDRQPRAYRFMVGDNSEIGILSGRPSRDARVRACAGAVFCAWRSGEISTTFQASFSRFIARMTTRGRVDLPPLQAVHRGAREGVVVVVPGLAERRQREPEHVGRVVLDVEAAAAEEVAHRVDRPGDVVEHEDAHEAAPHQAGERALERAGEEVAEAGREQQADEHDAEEAAADEAHAAVLDEVAGVLRALRAAVGVEQPAHVRVPEPVQRAQEAVAVADVRGVRVALLVGVGVVLAVVGDPRDDRALDRHRPERGEHVLDRLVGLERPVREQAVVADGDAETGDTYMIASTARSVQPTYWFHSRTIAAMKARNGTIAPTRFESLCARVMAWMVPVNPRIAPVTQLRISAPRSVAS